MHVRWGVLESGVVLGDDGLYILGSFVVEFVELWAITADFLEMINFGVGFDDFGAIARFDGVRFDVVGIYCIENDNIVASAI